MINSLLSASSLKANFTPLVTTMVIVMIRVAVAMASLSASFEPFKAKYRRWVTFHPPLFFGTEEEVSGLGSLYGRQISSFSDPFQELYVCFQTHPNLGRGASSCPGHAVTSHTKFQRDLSLVSLV